MNWTWRALSVEDAGAIAELLHAAEAVEPTHEHYSVDDVREELTAPNVRLPDGSTSAWDSGRLIGYAMAVPREEANPEHRMRVELQVHPECRELGKPLIEWLLATAPKLHSQTFPQAPLELHARSHENQRWYAALLTEAGFTRSRSFATMRADLRGAGFGPDSGGAALVRAGLGLDSSAAALGRAGLGPASSAADLGPGGSDGAALDPGESSLADLAPADIGRADLGPAELGRAELGRADLGPMGPGAAALGPVGSGAADSSPVNSGPPDLGPVDTGRAGLGPDSGGADLGPGESSLADLGMADIGRADFGPADLARADLGPAGSGAAVVPHELPADLRLAGYAPEHEEATRLALNEAFRGHWGMAAYSPELFRHRVTGSPVFRPESSFLLLSDAGEVASFVLSAFYESDAEATGVRELQVSYVGTRAASRGRGVATALLAHTLRVAREQGYERAALGVDESNAHNALNIYRRVGFEVSDRQHAYIRRIP
ncbi:ribosomal protein S18 acetylase RimI-like enzyme [Amycolatopsis bartoniae]|uniref:GNAT family N-acetyltransferase n=1 Tax=Amycolatopsis bartoniae TaxID=941986 RepID=UPI001191C394|nr:N-acetyltransferase [Amycolatopsis bartoniae]MBB2935893.1 ribosomal protein S18 acetylase RimI-like enzyme [Amycolatopsis bartoniae]TVT02669.1 GNAT family N-acetyltransferase [Amycolatopsis bartoniae]